MKTKEELIEELRYYGLRYDEDDTIQLDSWFTLEDLVQMGKDAQAILDFDLAFKKCKQECPSMTHNNDCKFRGYVLVNGKYIDLN